MIVIAYGCVTPGYDDPPNDGRQHIAPPTRFAHPRMNARMVKLLPHKFLPPHDVSVWLDGNIIVPAGIDALLEDFAGAEVGAFAHDLRATVDEEITACAGFDHPERLCYHAGQPGRLAGTSMLIRRNIPAVNALNESWWAELCVGSWRDQLSFPYTLGTIATLRPCWQSRLKRCRHLIQDRAP